MPSLKSLRDRIRSVKQTKKITSAMKMVASAKLKRAQTTAENGRLYSSQLKSCLMNVVNQVEDFWEKSPLLTGYPDSKKTLLVVVTADRGLCGSFNTNLIKTAKNVLSTSSEIDILTVGKKGRDAFKGQWIESYPDWTKDPDIMTLGQGLGQQVLRLLKRNQYKEIILVSSYFKNMLCQEMISRVLVPLINPDESIKDPKSPQVQYLIDQSATDLLSQLAKSVFSNQLYQALCETLACEHAARMTAMDNATRNANDMIKDLELYYNRSRQATITRELIEIISGAKSLG